VLVPGLQLPRPVSSSTAMPMVFVGRTLGHSYFVSGSSTADVDPFSACAVATESLMDLSEQR
jgi:hypothetical protein